MEYVYLVWDLQPGQLAGPRKLKHGMMMMNGVPVKVAKPVAPRVMQDYRSVRFARAADFTTLGLEVPAEVQPPPPVLPLEPEAQFEDEATAEAPAPPAKRRRRRFTE